MGNLTSHLPPLEVFISFFPYLIPGTLVLLLERGWERADRQMREHGVASFPGSEMLDKQNLMAKLHCER